MFFKDKKNKNSQELTHSLIINVAILTTSALIFFCLFVSNLFNLCMKSTWQFTAQAKVAPLQFYRIIK